jgi:hypothetical protein
LYVDFTLAPVSLSAFTITATWAAAWLLFYTSFDKSTQTLAPSKLVDVLLCRGGLLKSLHEVNKVLALLALSLLATAALGVVPHAAVVLRAVGLAAVEAALVALREHLAWHGAVSAALHATFSAVYWFKLNPLAWWADRKWFAVGIGGVAFAVLAASAVVRGRGTGMPVDAAVSLACLIAMLHFVLMESNAAGAIDVRPFALLPLFVGLFIAASLFLVHVWSA